MSDAFLRSLFDDLDSRTLRPIRDVEGLARYGDPDTSQSAARSITGRTERLVLAVFKKFPDYDGGWTADELCGELPTIFPPTLKSALSRLANHKLIVDSGERRASARGRDSIVWRLAADLEDSR